MGSGLSQLTSCLKPSSPEDPRTNHLQDSHNHPSGQVFAAADQLDEALGHSFCYARSSSRFLPSPNTSARFLSPTNSLRFDEQSRPASETSGFKAISGAAVSANSFTAPAVLPENIFDDVVADHAGARSKSIIVNGFESTSSFSALPLQPAPRFGDGSGSIERGFLMSGPIERGALSGPLDSGAAGSSDAGGVPFSAPLGGMYGKKTKKKNFIGIRKTFYRNFSEKKRPWVVPVRYLIGRRDVSMAAAASRNESGRESLAMSESNVQWALGKAGEDRVHVVVSEEHGWLFVGIYDGFNGPDAPEFLMCNLYRSVFNELGGLFWDVEDAQALNVASSDYMPLKGSIPTSSLGHSGTEAGCSVGDFEGRNDLDSQSHHPDQSEKSVTFQFEQSESRRKRLWEFLAEDDPHGLDLSGSERFSFSVDDALSVSNAGSAMGRRGILLSRLKHGLSKHKEGNGRRFFPWRFALEDKEKLETEKNRVEERACRCTRKRKLGPVDDQLVLLALSRALEVTELAYLGLTDKFLDTNPELALMGSCLLVVLMRDEDVYVMNLGDSRAIVAQFELQETISEMEHKEHDDAESTIGGIVEEPTATGDNMTSELLEAHACEAKLIALQLSTDHSTSIKEEVTRIKNEHPDDNHCIVNDRVKGRLKVTRAFGAGFLKQPKLNDALLEMFRNDYIGTAPYLSCSPSLHHHKLCPRDQFLVLSSDGLYQYFNNEEVVSHVVNFMEKFPEGDPAQHLIEELLYRAAKKAGMDFHELLDIPHGDRRKYHDDVTVMVISLEGRIWKSSGKYV